MTWPSQSGVACEKYLNALYALCTYVQNEQDSKKDNAEATEKDNNAEAAEKEAEEEEEANELLYTLQRILKHLVIAVLPNVTESSVRLRTIWILAQFVSSYELQKVLLGLVLYRLTQTQTVDEELDQRYAAFEHVDVAAAPRNVDLAGHRGIGRHAHQNGARRELDAVRPAAALRAADRERQRRAGGDRVQGHPEIPAANRSVDPCAREVRVAAPLSLSARC